MKEYPETALLEQVGGVGPITSLRYVLTIEDPRRIDRSRNVGAYLGLRPKQRQSGQRDPELRITKAGDRDLRRLLVQCSQQILGPFGKDCDLRRWGLELAGRLRPAPFAQRFGKGRSAALTLGDLWRQDLGRPDPAMSDLGAAWRQTPSRSGARRANSRAAGSSTQPASSRPSALPSGAVATISARQGPAARGTSSVSHTPGSLPLGAALSSNEGPSGGVTRSASVASWTATDSASRSVARSTRAPSCSPATTLVVDAFAERVVDADHLRADDDRHPRHVSRREPLREEQPKLKASHGTSARPTRRRNRRARAEEPTSGARAGRAARR